MPKKGLISRYRRKQLHDRKRKSPGAIVDRAGAADIKKSFFDSTYRGIYRYTID